MKQAGLDVYQDGNPYVMHHKVFVLDGSRQVICAAKLDCIDEQAARRRAEQMHDEHDVEQMKNREQREADQDQAKNAADDAIDQH